MGDVFRRFVLYPLEALLLGLFFIVFRLLPLKVASALGGFIGRTVGPGLGISRRAERNITCAFPDMPPADIKGVVADMWENLGRTAAEYPNLGRFRFAGPDNVGEIIGADIITRLRDDNKAAILVGGHIANWEVMPAALNAHGLTVDRVYRMANNPLVEHLYRLGRGSIEGGQIPKGVDGARLLVKAVRNGRHIGMLVDQKMNDGIPVPFFGRDAMTAPAAAELAIKYDIPLVVVRIERIKGVQFRITVLPPLDPPATGDRHRDAAKIMAQVNGLLESWIRERPGQWLWLHNRWPE